MSDAPDATAIIYCAVCAAKGVEPCRRPELGPLCPMRACGARPVPKGEPAR